MNYIFNLSHITIIKKFFLPVFFASSAIEDQKNKVLKIQKLYLNPIISQDRIEIKITK